MEGIIMSNKETKKMNNLLMWKPPEEREFSQDYSVEIPDFIRKAILVGFTAFITYLAKELGKMVEKD